LKVLLIFVAVAASLPMAWISLSKIALVAGALWTRWFSYNTQTTNNKYFSIENISPLNKVIYFSIAWILLSTAWTPVDVDTAIYAFVKHAKILIIPLIVYIATSEKLGSKCLNYALYTQIGVCIVSWFLAIKFSANKYLTENFVSLNLSGQNFNVFSESQLDQSIMFVVSAAIIWHIRNTIPISKWIIYTSVFLFLTNVLFLANSRTGYVLAIASVTLAIYYLPPFKFKWAALIMAPFLLISSLLLSSQQFSDRVNQVAHEVQSTEQPGNVKTSSGWRLNAWQRSIEAFYDRPILGHGLGSWAYAAKKAEGDKGNDVFGNGIRSNPHQESLLWTVEFGLMGILLKIMFIYSVFVSSKSNAPQYSNAITATLLCILLAGLFNSVIFDDLIGDFLLIFLALCLAAGQENKNIKPKNTHDQ
jgi:O-antigen ligase